MDIKLKAKKLAPLKSIHHFFNEVESIVFKAQRILIEHSTGSNLKIEEQLSVINQNNPHLNLKFDQQYRSFSFNYSIKSIKEDFGTDSIQLWKRLFVRLSKGGVDKEGEIFVSRWAFSEKTFNKLNERRDELKKQLKSKTITNYIKVLSVLENEELSVEYTDFEVVNVKRKTDFFVEKAVITGIKGTKKLVGPIKKQKIKIIKRNLKLHVEEFNKDFKAKVQEKIKSVTDTLVEISGEHNA